MSDLDALRAHDRDFVTYLQRFRDKYSKIELAEYVQGQDESGPWVSLCMRQWVEITGPNPRIDIHLLEHWSGDRLVVDYYVTSKYVRKSAGRDVYYAVADDKGLYGYFVVTIFGFEQSGLFSGFSFDAEDVKDNIARTLGYFTEAAR